MKFEHWQSELDSKWYWHLRADNHEIVAQGEGYETERACLHGVSLVQQSASATLHKVTPPTKHRKSRMSDLLKKM